MSEKSYKQVIEEKAYEKVKILEELNDIATADDISIKLEQWLLQNYPNTDAAVVLMAIADMLAKQALTNGFTVEKFAAAFAKTIISCATLLTNRETK